jgi:hypothetical protein
VLTIIRLLAIVVVFSFIAGMLSDIGRPKVRRSTSSSR